MKPHHLWGLDRILWQRPLRRWESWVWFAMLVLAPAALVLSIVVQQKATQRIGLRIPATRQQAIAAARKEAIAYGVHPEGWSTTMWVDLKPSLTHYLQMQTGHMAEAMRHMAPPSTLHVRFRSPDEQSSMEVLLDPEARPIGFHRQQPTAMDMTSGNDPVAARTLAEESMRECMEIRMPHMPMPQQPEVQRQASGEDVFTWEAQVPDHPELTLQYSASVRGLVLLNTSVTPKLDANYEKSIEPLPWLKPTLKFLGFLIGLILFVFVFVRYIQRLLQGEVSRERMLMVSIVVGGAYVLYMLCGDQVAVQSSGPSQAPYWVIVLFGGFFMLLLGVAGGIAYAGTEGDLRDRYASKMTSLDALLSGAVSNRNVGGAVVVGAALASWLLLLHALLEWTIGSSELGSEQVNVVQMIPFSRAPWLMILLAAPTTAVLFSVLGLLLPKVFALRLVRNRRMAFLLFLAIAFIVTCALSERTTSTAALVLDAALRLGVMTLAFYTLDFLTCLVLAGVFSVVATAATLLELVPGLRPGAPYAAAAGMLALVAAIYALWRGRTVDDEEVRPQYAKNVAERLQLEEELEATREAHVRLLPPAPPKVPGVTLAATCQAAESVSGDFYDFFTLAPHRVGLLLAEGGRGGLATALSIALAKGYVTQKARSGVTPATILQSLQSTLGELMEGQSDLGGILYAVVDTNELTLQYACLGASPQILVLPEDGVNYERTTKLGGRVLREGILALPKGARAIFYTNGLGMHVGGSVTQWLRLRLRRHGEGDAEAIQKTILQELLRQNGRHSTRVRGDITFVLLAAMQQQVKERVA